MFTCIKCEHHYDHLTGDLDERMCHECLDEENDNDNIQLTTRVEIIYRTQSIRVDYISCGCSLYDRHIL